MPTGVEYRAKLLVLNQKLSLWCDLRRQHFEMTPRGSKWAALAVAYSRAGDELAEAYQAVVDNVLAEIEQQWGGGTTNERS